MVSTKGFFFNERATVNLPPFFVCKDEESEKKERKRESLDSNVVGWIIR